METQGKSYKNHFVCVEIPERQTANRQIHKLSDAAKRQRGRRMHGLTIKEYKRVDKQEGKRDTKKKGRRKEPEDMSKDRQQRVDA